MNHTNKVNTETKDDEFEGGKNNAGHVRPLNQRVFDSDSLSN